MCIDKLQVPRQGGKVWTEKSENEDSAFTNLGLCLHGTNLLI